LEYLKSAITVDGWKKRVRVEDTMTPPPQGDQMLSEIPDILKNEFPNLAPLIPQIQQAAIRF
jgi:hypothetical protein